MNLPPQPTQISVTLTSAELVQLQLLHSKMASRDGFWPSRSNPSARPEWQIDQERTAAVLEKLLNAANP
jgi:hypothetical protein